MQYVSRAVHHLAEGSLTHFSVSPGVSFRERLLTNNFQEEKKTKKNQKLLRWKREHVFYTILLDVQQKFCI